MKMRVMGVACLVALIPSVLWAAVCDSAAAAAWETLYWDIMRDVGGGE